MTASDYDPLSWARQTSLGRRLYNHNFRMTRKGPSGWALVKEVPMGRDSKRTETTWLWQSKEAPEQALVQVNVTEAGDWRAAQQHLLLLLDHCMRPSIPRGSGDLAIVGDVAFVASDPVHDLPASALLARGNVTAAIRSVGSLTVDVSEFVKLVDKLLSAAPDRALAKSSESRTLALRAQEKGGVTELPVDLEAMDAWLKLIASDGELRRKGRAIVYVAGENGEPTVEVIVQRSSPATQR